MKLTSFNSFIGDLGKVEHLEDTSEVQETSAQEAPATPRSSLAAFERKCIKNTLLSPGKMISLSRLIARGVFRDRKTKGKEETSAGKAMAEKVALRITEMKIGEMHYISVGNNSKVKWNFYIHSHHCRV